MKLEEQGKGFLYDPYPGSFDFCVKAKSYGYGKERKLKYKNLLVTICLVLILALVPVLNAQAGASQKTLYIDWHNVVPSGSGDPNMLGDGTITVNAGKAQICYDLRIFIYFGTSDWPPTSIGIYNAPVGENGPLVADLNPVWGSLGTPNISGCVNVSSTLAHNIQKHPADYYVLVTDSSYPDGAARAQLKR